MRAAIPEQRKAELLQALWNDPNERVDNLPDDEKRFLLGYIRDFRKTSSAPAAYELQLIQLGDEEAMSRSVSVFDKHPDGSLELGISRQPRIIERMAPTMFHEESAARSPREADFEPGMRSVGAAYMVAKVLSTCEEIPEPVRRWAKETYQASEEDQGAAMNEKLRASLRQWWKDNETAMRAQNWAAVKPGPSIASTDAPPLSRGEKVPSREPPSSKPAQREEKTGPPVTMQPAVSSPRWKVYLAAGLLAVLALGLALRFVRKGS